MEKLEYVATDDEIFLKICLLVSTEYTNVTNRQTDMRDGTGRAYAEHRAAMMEFI